MTTKTTETRFDALRAAVSWTYRNTSIEVNYVEKIWGSDQESHWEIVTCGTGLDIEGAEKALAELQEGIRLVKTIESWSLEKDPEEGRESHDQYVKYTEQIVKLLRAGDFEGIKGIMEMEDETMKTPTTAARMDALEKAIAASFEDLGVEIFQENNYGNYEKPAVYEISWKAMGTMSADYTLSFSQALKDAAELAEMLNGMNLVEEAEETATREEMQNMVYDLADLITAREFEKIAAIMEA